MPDAFDLDCTDGAGFSVVLRDADGAEHELFRSVIERSEISRKSPHPLDLAFDCANAAHLLLRTDAGPAGDATCDWTFWTEVAITDEPLTRSTR